MPRACERAREIALETVRWPAGFDFPDFEQDLRVRRPAPARRVPDQSRPRRLRPRARHRRRRSTTEHFVEEHVAHSTALHAQCADGGTYLVGPLARFALNFDELPPLAQRGGARCRAGPPCAAIRFAASSSAPSSSSTPSTRRSRSSKPTRRPQRPSIDVLPKRGLGHGATEAPRGLLYHRYEIDDDGTILDARDRAADVAEPAAIEDDLRELVRASLDLPDDRAAAAMRADGPQLRSLHLLRDAFLEA